MILKKEMKYDTSVIIMIINIGITIKVLYGIDVTHQNDIVMISSSRKVRYI
jgi:hypothetical protein